MAKRILIVEDYDASRSMLASFLQSIGYETIEATTGIQGLKKARSEKPHLVLMDLALPGITGIDAARALKEQATTADIPVIGYSALSSRYVRKQAFGAGMVEYLAKPVSLDLIKKTIERYILP
jgi:two-component system, cell cycle response regulator DivK